MIPYRNWAIDPPSHSTYLIIDRQLTSDCIPSLYLEILTPTRLYPSWPVEGDLQIFSCRIFWAMRIAVHSLSRTFRSV